ncbi:MAG: MoxR family ATPase [Candidatus Kapaibacteriales bacterium]
MSKETEAVLELGKDIAKLKNELAKVIVGQEETIEQLIYCLLAKGNCLLMGVPGLAKTLLIKTLSESMDLGFSRIQFTPDLMPGDITGSEVIEDDKTTGQKVFRFVKGPIFANIVLADEINRTPPKTQAALLEAMQEKEITAAGTSYKLEEPFFVLATQNPIEQEGTYPLPEAQLDRFMFNILLDYPSRDEERSIVRSTTSSALAEVDKVLDGDKIIKYQELVRQIPVPDNVINYAVDLVRATRPSPDSSQLVKEYINYGAGPRASQYLILGAKARAAVSGRFSPEVADVKAVAVPVLRHRIVASFKAEADRLDTSSIVKRLIEEVKL